MLWLAGRLPWAEPLKRAIEKFYNTGKGCYHPHNEVKAEEDGLLRGARGEAVHRVGAREALAGEIRLHREAIQQPLAQEKSNLCQDAEGHVDHIKPPEIDFFFVVLAGNCLGFGATVFLVMVMHGVHEENQRRSGDEDDVKHPESVLRDWEGHVVAHLLAARLEGVAHKLLLFIFK